ncbi:hypothetical protein ACH41H_29655 [Streptomyces sp. NPDC020800]|uniref:hypothetical protein n=1 Tax=Streptomyces sp. NPDC020800 TaxID=3365092 RepID=UPI0037B4A71D
MRYAGHVVLRGSLEEPAPRLLAPLAGNRGEAPARFLPALGAAFDRLTPWERTVWTLQVRPRPAAVPHAVAVRRLEPADAEAVRALGTDACRLSASWGGPACLAALCTDVTARSHTPSRSYSLHNPASRLLAWQSVAAWLASTSTTPSGAPWHTTGSAHRVLLSDLAGFGSPCLAADPSGVRCAAQVRAGARGSGQDPAAPAGSERQALASAPS